MKKKKYKTYFYKNNFVIFGRRKNIGVAFLADCDFVCICMACWGNDVKLTLKELPS